MKQTIDKNHPLVSHPPFAISLFLFVAKLSARANCTFSWAQDQFSFLPCHRSHPWPGLHRRTRSLRHQIQRPAVRTSPILSSDHATELTALPGEVSQWASQPLLPALPTFFRLLGDLALPSTSNVRGWQGLSPQTSLPTLSRETAATPGLPKDLEPDDCPAEGPSLSPLPETQWKASKV